MRFAAAIAFAALAGCSAAQPAPLKVGEQPFGQARSALKAEVALELDRPGKAVVLVFFATWSEAARAVLPQVEKLHAGFAEKGVEVVGVAIDEDQRFVAPFVRELGVSFPVLADPGARQTERLARLESVPTVVVLDAERTVRMLSRGPLAIREVESLLVQLATTPVD